MATENLKIIWIILLVDILLFGVDAEYRTPHFGRFTPHPVRTTEAPVSRAPIITAPVCADLQLDFSNMGMERFHGKVARHSDVTFLNLSYNLISHIPSESFAESPRLHTLDLSGNRIPVKELLQLDHLRNLITLYHNNNNHTLEKKNQLQITESREPLPKLKNLFLRSNSITEISISWRSFAPRLSHLDLSDNDLKSSKFVEDLPETLTHLYLDDNSIKEIDYSALHNIAELSIQRNKLETLCIGDCSDYSISLRGYSLKNVQLSGNNIKEIEIGVQTNTQKFLETLNISHNHLTEIPNGTFHYYGQLRHLSLSHNKLVEVPNLCSLRSLVTLDLSGNRITTITSRCFCSSAMLNELNLADNQIVTVHHYGFDLRSLQTLDLSGNQLSKLPYYWLYPSHSIQILRLRNNSISDMNEISLNGMLALREIHIQENPLTYFIVNVFTNLTANLKVYIRDPWSQVPIVSNIEEEESDEENSVFSWT